MHVSLFEYRLTGIDEAGWATICADLAPSFTRVPGLASKIWLRGDTGELGGVYLWNSDDCYRTFLASDLAAALRAHPNIDGLTMRDWGVDDALTAITDGVLQP